jgi:long-chain fatty acid transport protein
LTAGLGVFTPFGLSTDWPEDWDGRFQVTHVSVQTLTANPAMAWKPLRWLAVGAGASASYVKIEQRRALNLAVFGPTTPEGAVSLEGNAIGLGWNAGLLVTPSDLWSVGVSLRSRIHAEVKDGHAVSPSRGRCSLCLPMGPFEPSSTCRRPSGPACW